MNPTAKFADFSLGDTIWFERTFEQQEFAAFSRLSGDRNPLHDGTAYAEGTRFERPIVPLHLAAAPLSSIAGMAFPGESSLYLEHTLLAHRPIYYGESLTYSARIVGLTPICRILRIRVCVFRGLDLVLEASMTIQARCDEWSGAPAWEILKAKRRRTCLITGASGAIGLATARLLAARGWNLILHHRSGDAGRIVAECSPAEGVIQVLKADLATEDGITVLASVAERGEADAVVHCASAPIDASIGDLVSVNFSALRSLRDTALKSMLRRQEGRFVLVGSQAVDFLPAGWDNYAAAKVMAQALMNSIEKRYGRFGIRAGTLAPSYVASPFSDKWRPSEAIAILPEEVAANVVRMVEEDMSAYRVLDASGARDESGPVWAAASGGTLAMPTEPRSHARDNDVDHAAMDEIVRRTLDLPAESDLSRTGLGLTPTWDSLRHIQLVVALEQQLGFSFTSQEIDGLHTYADLKLTCQRKSSGATAR